MRTWFKKCLILTAVMLPLSAIYISPSKAADASSSVLSLIAQMVANIIQPDNLKNSPTPQLQSYFAGIGNQYLQNISTQDNNNLLLQVTAATLNQPISSFGSRNPAILGLLPTVNNMIYSSMIGLPPVSKAAFSPMAYIQNAGALNTIHVMPGLNWQGPTIDQQKYFNFYSTIVSVESFDGYILNYLLAENSNGNKMSPLQLSLITEASASNFIAQLAAETIGQVLRQLLMFTSQIYVLLTQMITLERQQLTAQVMTNSLLILSNQNNEILLSAKAQGIQPMP